MKLIKFLFIASVLTTRTCRPEIVVATSNLDEPTSNLVKDLVKIVTSCYGDRLQTVGLAGSLPHALPRTLSTEHLIPVVLVDDARNDPRYEARVPERFRHKVQVFIIEASTSQQVDVIIQMNIKFSAWWNHMASFLIVDRSPGCVNAFKFLWTAWYRDALNSKVLCYGSESVRTIYNYNPFTDQAPVPWRRYAVRQGIIDHPFTLFYRKYQANESICINLDFDKTKDLGGYEIRLERYDWSKFTYAQLYKVYTRHAFLSEKIWSTVCRALNGTMEFVNKTYAHYSSTDIGSSSDIGLYPSEIGGYPHISRAYPHGASGLVIMSQYRYNKSLLNKILRVIDVDSRIGIVIVYLITFIFLKFFVHQAMMPTFLNIIRITCDTRFGRLPNTNTASRIFISCLLLFSLIMQEIVRCKLAVLLMTKIPLQNVNTIEDIQTFDYKVCERSGTGYSNYVGISKTDSISSLLKDCYQYTKNDASIAYLENSLFFDSDKMQELDVHISQDFIGTQHYGFKIRKDWALQQTVERTIATLVEADAREPWNLKSWTPKLSDFQVDKKFKNTDVYKPLNFDELKFAFIILGIGLLSAIVSFIFESVIGYKCRITIEPP